MNYGFWISGQPDQDRLAAAVAEMLSLPVESVDVGLEGDDDRNWSAPVSCTVTPITGDLHQHLDIYLGAAVRNPPSEPAAAAWLAPRLRTVVAYEAMRFPPSAFWLVAPDGRRTRARIYEEDGGGDLAAYRIDAVEQPVAALPGVRVQALPEVIREHRMPTPATDRLRETSATAGDVASHLGGWETLVARLTEGWPPDGWYPAAYYREDLTTRDQLTAAIEMLPEPARRAVEPAMSEVDARFIEATVDDGGHALTIATGPLPSGAAWWWRRVPQPLPWQNAPGQAAP